jgi:hypothetical protein
MLEGLRRFQDSKFEIVCKVPEWAKAYGVEPMAIERQVLIAEAWCNSNPKKAPKKNVIRFLFNWISKAQKMGNLVANHRSFKETRASDDELVSGEDFKALRLSLARMTPHEEA